MIFNGLPSIRIDGSSNVQIYNHKGVRTITNELVEIVSSIGLVCIDGKELQIMEISGEYVAVKGKISKIYYRE